MTICKIDDNVINGDYINYDISIVGYCSISNYTLSGQYSNSLSIIAFDTTNINNMNINGYNASIVSLEFNGMINNSYINGSNSNSLSMICGDTMSYKKESKCHNVSLSVKEMNNTLNKTYSSLICYKYGCEYLILYTINGANDINITGKECDCNEDIITACINKWDIYCGHGINGNNYKNKSTLYSASNCTGDSGICCENVIEQLHINECKWNPKQNKTNLLHDDIWYIIIGSSATVICCIVLIIIWCWRKKRIEASNDAYLAKHRNLD